VLDDGEVQQLNHSLYNRAPPLPAGSPIHIATNFKSTVGTRLAIGDEITMAAPYSKFSSYTVNLHDPSLTKQARQEPSGSSSIHSVEAAEAEMTAAFSRLVGQDMSKRVNFCGTHSLQ
jgi:hypothetical protein